MKLPFGMKKKSKVPEKQFGRFVVVDGPDGSGKSTQASMLVETLRTEGFDAVYIKFPQYGEKSAGVLEEYLSGKYGELNPYAASIFFAVDRFDAGFKIREWLKEGKVVVSDRYVTANAGHQGAKFSDSVERVKFFKWLDNLEYKTFQVPKPDLNIILHMPANLAGKLLSKRYKSGKSSAWERKPDILESQKGHAIEAEKAYLEIAKLFPNTKLLECAFEGRLLTPLEVHNQLWDLVRRIALKDLKPNL